MKTFKDLGIPAKLADHLSTLGITNPTPVQTKAIPVARAGKDIVGVAETGTGKTFAFLIPMFERIKKQGGTGLVILPTRELAQQVEDEFIKIAKPMHLKCVRLVGGEDYRKQLRGLKARPDVIIATPGRLIDHLQQKTLNLSKLTSLVFDEADRMMDMGFLPQIKQVMQFVPAKRQTMLFSATMSGTIKNVIKQYLKNPERIEIARSGKPSANVDQQLYIVREEDKIRLLDHILHEYTGLVIVFIRTKYRAKKITKSLSQMGYKVDELHSNRTQNQRKRVMEGFRSGKFRILVATDIAARGIDVPNIEAVVNYDIPDQTEDYVHRIGRTGRAGNTGIAFTFAMRSQSRAIRDIEKFMGQRLNLRQLPSLPARRVDKESLRQFKADKRRRHEPKNKKKYGDRSRREDSRSESGSRNKKRKPFSKNGDAGQGKSDWNRPFKSRRNRSANTSGRPSFRGKNNQSGGGKNRRTRSVTTRRSSR